MDMHGPAAMVSAFHGKFNFPIDIPFRPEGMTFEVNLAIIEIINQQALVMEKWAESIKAEALLRQKQGDERLYRCHLIVEEVAETLHALCRGDKVELADGLADLQYVTAGTGVTFGIPHDEVFNEVHRSNMTKQRKKSDPRMRDKGSSYSPPDIEGVIRTAFFGEYRRIAERASTLSREVIDVEAGPSTPVKED